MGYIYSRFVGVGLGVYVCMGFAGLEFEDFGFEDSSFVSLRFVNLGFFGFMDFRRLQV